MVQFVDYTKYSTIQKKLMNAPSKNTKFIGAKVIFFVKKILITYIKKVHTSTISKYTADTPGTTEPLKVEKVENL